MRAYHLTSALVLGSFLVLHLTNHLVGLAGQVQHAAFMQELRPVYRNIFVESALLSLFAFQVVSGLTLVIRGWRLRRGAVAWLQAGSGVYLAAFVVLHVLAVLWGRVTLGLDTDFRFAAAGFHVPGWPWYFWPYYTLAVFSLFAHIGSAIYWRTLRNSSTVARRILAVMLSVGALLGLLISSSLAAVLHPVDIPAHYKAIYIIE